MSTMLDRCLRQALDDLAIVVDRERLHDLVDRLEELVLEDLERREPRRFPDPFAELDGVERLQLVLRQCASGARADLPGRPVRPMPGWVRPPLPPPPRGRRKPT